MSMKIQQAEALAGILKNSKFIRTEFSEEAKELAGKKIKDMSANEYLTYVKERGIDLSQVDGLDSLIQYANAEDNVKAGRKIINGMYINGKTTVRQALNRLNKDEYVNLREQINFIKENNASFNGYTLPTFTNHESYATRYNRTLSSLIEYSKSEDVVKSQVETYENYLLKNNILSEDFITDPNGYYNKTHTTIDGVKGTVDRTIYEKLKFLKGTYFNIDEMRSEVSDAQRFVEEALLGDENLYHPNFLTKQFDRFTDITREKDPYSLRDKHHMLFKWVEELDELRNLNPKIRELKDKVEGIERYHGEYDNFLGTDFYDLDKYSQKKTLEKINEAVDNGSFENEADWYYHYAHSLSVDPEERYKYLNRYDILKRKEMIEERYNNRFIDVDKAEEELRSVYGKDFLETELYRDGEVVGTYRDLYTKKYQDDKKNYIDLKLGDISGNMHAAAGREEKHLKNLEEKHDLEFSTYFDNLSYKQKQEVAKLAEDQGYKIEHVTIKDRNGNPIQTYYYRVDEKGRVIDQLPPQAEQMRNMYKNREIRKEAKSAQEEAEEKAAKNGSKTERYIYTGKPIEGTQNPANSKAEPIPEEEIIDIYMQNAHNVNREFQSEVANPARTTLDNSTKLRELAMKGFKMENARTLMGTVGALTLFEATMYSANNDAELHRRRVEEERRRKKYGY